MKIHTTQYYQDGNYKTYISEVPVEEAKELREYLAEDEDHSLEEWLADWTPEESDLYEVVLKSYYIGERTYDLVED